LSALTRSYAEALADVAFEQNRVEAVKRELASFVELTKRSLELRNFLESPAVPLASKHGAISRLAERLGASEAVRNFLFVLVDHRRSALLAEIAKDFTAVLNERMGIAEAQVTSARELTPEEKAELVATLARVTGKKIEARYRLDPELIGGAVVQVGSTIYNGSVRQQLERLRARLAAS
jgi:F-type H+-transporting ATPase subunit delta